MPHVAIIGGGISGLSLAWFLRLAHAGTSRAKSCVGTAKTCRQSKLRISIIESSERLGGWVRTDRIDGHILERGPRGFRPKGNGVETLKLIESLGLQGATIAPSMKSSNRFVYSENELQKLPSSFVNLFLKPPPLMKGVVRTLATEVWRPQNKTKKDESIYDFVSRRLSEDIANNLVDAMISGIYSGDIKKLSVRSCSPLNKLWECEQAHGSIIKGMVMSLLQNRRDVKQEFTPSSFVQKMQKAPQISFINAMEHLTETLGKKLAGNSDTTIYTNFECIGVEQKEEKLNLTLLDQSNVNKDAQMIEGFDHVFSTIPANRLMDALPTLPSLQGAKSLLNKMKHSVNVAVVNLVYSHPKLIDKDGFGYLIPSKAKEGILGVAWDSSIFPTQIDPHTLKGNQLDEFNNTSRVTVMIGGANYPEVATKSEDELIDIAVSKFTQHLGIDGEKYVPKIMVAGVMHECIPQYHVGHHEKLKNLEAALTENLPQLTFLGTSFYGVGVADCVANAKLIAEKYVNSNFGAA